MASADLFEPLMECQPRYHKVAPLRHLGVGGRSRPQVQNEAVLVPVNNG